MLQLEWISDQLEDVRRAVVRAAEGMRAPHAVHKVFAFHSDRIRTPQTPKLERSSETLIWNAQADEAKSVARNDRILDQREMALLCRKFVEGASNEL